MSMRVRLLSLRKMYATYGRTVLINNTDILPEPIFFPVADMCLAMTFESLRNKNP